MNTNQKHFLIISPSPGIGIFLNAIKNTLENRSIKVTLITDQAKTQPATIDSKLDQALINQWVKYDNVMYNPENNQQLQQQLVSYIKKSYYHLKHIFDDNQFTGVLLWSSWPVFSQIASHLAKHQNTRIWYMENGFLPNTIQLDSQGINYASSLSSKNADFFLSRGTSTKTTNELRTFIPWHPQWFYFFKMLGKYINKFGYFWFIKRIFWKNFLPDQYGKYLRKNLPPATIQLPKKFIFIPLQVEDDTQIIFYSSLIKNMTEFIEICYQAIRQISPDIGIVVKEHPQDFGRHSYKYLQTKYLDIIWLKKYPIEKLISQSTAVITINSSVGVEALKEHKHVVTLGQALYNIPGLVHHAETKEALPPLIQQVLTTTPNYRLIDAFINYLNNVYLIHGGWKKFSQETIDEIINRLLK